MNRILKHCCLLFFTCVLLSCQVRLPNGSLKIEIADPSTRSISAVSQPVPDKYTVYLYSGMTNALLKSVDVSASEPNLIFKDLITGTYSVSATGFVGEEPVTFSQKESVSIKDGETEELTLYPVSVQVSPDSDTPLYGTVSIPVSWTTDIDVDRILLIDDNEEVIASLAVEPGARSTTLKCRCEVGEHKVRIRIEKDSLALYESGLETMTVFSGCVSSAQDGAYLDLEFARANPAKDLMILTAEKNNELVVSFTLPSGTTGIGSVTLTLESGSSQLSRTLISPEETQKIRFQGLKSDTEYTATLTFCRTDGTITLPLSAVGRTLLDAEALEIEADDLTPGIGDAIHFTYTLTPSDADSLGLLWTSSDESVLHIDENGRAVALKDGEATVTCRIGNKGLTKALKVTVKKAESTVEAERTEGGVRLSWEPVRNATSYRVEYAFGDGEYTTLEALEGTTLLHSFTPVTGTWLNYRVIALFFEGECSALIGTSCLSADANDPAIEIEDPTLPSSSLISITGIEEGQCFKIGDSIPLTATTAETDALITWYINNRKAGEGETFVLDKDSAGLDFSTANGSQRLTVTVITPLKALSRSLVFCFTADENVNNNPL